MQTVVKKKINRSRKQKEEADSEVGLFNVQPDKEPKSGGIELARANQPYRGDRTLHDDIVRYFFEDEMFESKTFDINLDRSEKLHLLVKDMEGGKYEGFGKRPNGEDPFLVIANHPDSTVGAKQLRRIFNFGLTVKEFQDAGIEPPLLGIAHYDIVRKLPSVQSRATILATAAKDEISVQELIGIVDAAAVGQKTDKQKNENRKPRAIIIKDWKKSLQSLIGNSMKRLAAIDAEMTKKNAHLDSETMTNLRKLKEQVDYILGKAKA